jgi:hypothetical protein
MLIQDLHIFGITDDGTLWQTSHIESFPFPPPDASAWNPWQEVATPAPFVSVASAVTNGQDRILRLHLCGITHDGRVWHTLRTGQDSDWEPFEDLTDRLALHQNKLVSIAAAGLDELALCLVVQTEHGGHIVQTTRHDDGTWDPVLDITTPQQAGDPGSFTRISCAYFQPAPRVVLLDVCGITANGNLWYSSNLLKPPWLLFENVQKLSQGAPGHFGDVGIFDDGNGKLNVFAQSGGAIWHTSHCLQERQFAWQPTFDNQLMEQAGNPGSFGLISCASLNNDLHVCGITPDGKLWQTQYSFTNPTGWLPFVDLTQVTDSPTAFKVATMTGGNFIAVESGSSPLCRQFAAYIAIDTQQIQTLQAQEANNPNIRAQANQQIQALQQDIAYREQEEAANNCF